MKEATSISFFFDHRSVAVTFEAMYGNSKKKPLRNHTEFESNCHSKGLLRHHDIDHIITLARVRSNQLHSLNQ